MNRPIYENGEDRRKERKVADALEKTWNCGAIQLGFGYAADLLLFYKNKAVCWGEVKCRNVDFGVYPTLYLSFQKMCNLQNIHTVSGLPVLVIANYNDGIYWHKLKPPYQIEIGGRRDRGDPNDIEPLAVIPMESFKKLA